MNSNVPSKFYELGSEMCISKPDFDSIPEHILSLVFSPLVRHRGDGDRFRMNYNTLEKKLQVQQALQLPFSINKIHTSKGMST